MQRLLLAIVLLSSACASVPDPGHGAVPPASAQSTDATLAAELAALLQAMADSRWGLTDRSITEAERLAQAHLANDHISVYENGDTRTKEDIVNRSAPDRVKQIRSSALSAHLVATVGQVTTHAWSDSAVGHYQINMTLVLNAEPVSKTFRCTEVFRRLEGRWQSVLHTETVTPTSPVAAKIDSRLYDDYVGRYRLLPDVIFTITREGDRLLLGARKKLHLIPETENTFLIERDPERKVHSDTGYTFIFVRDANGRVSELRIREFPGVSYSAVRVE